MGNMRKKTMSRLRKICRSYLPLGEKWHKVIAAAKSDKDAKYAGN